MFLCAQKHHEPPLDTLFYLLLALISYNNFVVYNRHYL